MAIYSRAASTRAVLRCGGSYRSHGELAVALACGPRKEGT
jgi:hypothetical protein